MTVELISHTEKPLATIAMAASTCYKSVPNEKIVIGCIKTRHFSVTEHSSFTFKVTGLSRSAMAQITRHRIGSYSIESQRYVSYADSVEFVDPVFANNKIEEIFTNNVMSSLRDYEEMMKNGAKAEDARAVLPNAMPTTMVCTFNLRSFANVCNERLCSAAQKEIRDMVREMKKRVIEIFRYESDEFADFLDKHYLVPKCRAKEICYCTEREEKCCGMSPHVNKIKEKVGV